MGAAPGSVISLSALTGEAVNVVSASCSIHTGIALAFIDVRFTERSGPSRLAHAFLIEHSVHTHSVDAGILCTQVLFDVTALAGEPRRTVAGEVVDQIPAFRFHCAGTLRTVI